MKYLGMVAKIFKRKSGKKSDRIGSKKRGRPLKNISDLTQKQREILLNPNLTYREKAIELNMSVGWVAKWEKCLRQEMMEAFSAFVHSVREKRSL